MMLSTMLMLISSYRIREIVVIFCLKFQNALRSNSPPCVHLASSLTTRGRFCKEKPPYFQGLWMACGLTAIMSIHTFPAMFDGSDMMRPKDRSDVSHFP
ncbi:hypothetical protein Q1695_013533 [Nippostrongylus brasiliensis]|nr:hypothetical protein Q1695_013533 [Nippostrongylus brasiliensis]